MPRYPVATSVLNNAEKCASRNSSPQPSRLKQKTSALNRGDTVKEASEPVSVPSGRDALGNRVGKAVVVQAAQPLPAGQTAATAAADPFHRINLACASLRARLGWRSLRDLSKALYDAHKHFLPDNEARRLAVSATGVEPELLIASEVQRALSRMGCEVDERQLYRWAQRTAMAKERRAEIYLNQNGKRTEPGAVGSKQPKFRMIVSCRDGIRFQLSKQC